MSVSGPTPFDNVLPGQLIPPFALRSTTNQRVRSGELRGRRLILAFTGQAGNHVGRVLLNRLRGAYPMLGEEGAVAVAIAPVEVDTGMVAEPGIPLPFPLLRDPAATVHQRYGAVDWSGRPAASLFITDRFGRVIYRALSGLGETLPIAQDVVAFLRYDALSYASFGVPLPLPRR